MNPPIHVDLSPVLTQEGIDVTTLETRIGQLLRKTICSMKNVTTLQQVTTLSINCDLHALHSCFSEMINLEHLALAGRLRRIEHLRGLTKLKSIDFSNNRLTDTHGLELISSLESLRLDHNPISSLSLSFLSTLPNLRKLSLCGTFISSLLPTIEALKMLPNLEELHFHKDCASEDDQWEIQDEEDDDDRLSTASVQTARSAASASSHVSNSSSETVGSSVSLVSSVSALSTRTQRGEYLEVSEDDEEYPTYPNSSEEEGGGHDEEEEDESESEDEDDSDEMEDMAEDHEIPAPYKMVHMPTPLTTYPYYREYTITQLPKLKVLDKVAISYFERERAKTTVREKFELRADDPYFTLFTKNIRPPFKHKNTPNTNNTNNANLTTNTNINKIKSTRFEPFRHHAHSHSSHHSSSSSSSSSSSHAHDLYNSHTHNTKNNNDTEDDLHVDNNNRFSNTINNYNNTNQNNNIDYHSISNKMSKLILSKELGPMKAPVFRRGILSDRLSETSISRPPKLTVHQNSLFVPRQFEYHPTMSEYLLFGSTGGDVVILNQYNSKIVCHANARHQTNILGLCWLHQEPFKFLAGSDNGAVSLYDVNLMQNKKHPVVFNFPEFLELTSVHANSNDTLFVASGYSHDVGLFDIVSGKRVSTFKDIHSEHINVIKFANHNPNLFATSSFDRTIKLWDLRQPMATNNPVYSRTSDRGNVMVVFSPDDKYLLASAVDNEIRQYLCGDGRLHTLFETPKRSSIHNYTRSYYMNQGEYIIVGSCDENIVRIYNSGTGRLFREVDMSTLAQQYAMLYIQSLRGDPIVPFNFTVLVSYNPNVVSSRLVHVSLLETNE